MPKYKTNLTPGSGRKQSIRQRMKKIRDSKRTRQLLCDENVTPRPINVVTEEINISSTSSSATPPHQDVREEVPASNSSATPPAFREDVRVKVAARWCSKTARKFTYPHPTARISRKVTIQSNRSANCECETFFQ
ncbi:uncharacterized protein LOC130449116 [Diorhabda sublineata]|uniref:uncharacterized protein LOC130449116 n=1 Tax=Diorhabda sublineata TaxID=1163346 RepID=UPI0024E0F832|nr:uncharacterized protein LOC130449116 [Diorhabda sublineata]